MSESPAPTFSDPPWRPEDHARHDVRGPAPEVRQALELCRQLVEPGAEPGRRGDALDALETSLPAFDRAGLAALTGDPGYRSIRGDLLRACAATWFERECEMAEQALDGPASSTLTRLFGAHIPREAYADELAVLEALQPQRILILGSGPCPMSAIVIQDAFPAATIVSMDRSQVACTLSSRVLAASGYSKVEVRLGDAAAPAGIDTFDCVLMALTVGEDEAEKRRIIGAVRNATDPHATLVVRTAIGWGCVLYPAVDIPQIADLASRQSVRTSYQRSVAVPVRMCELQL